MPVRESPEFSLMGVERVQTVTAYTERLPHQIGHVDFAQRSGEILLGNRECRLDDCDDELPLRYRFVRLFDASHGIQNILRGDFRLFTRDLVAAVRTTDALQDAVAYQRLQDRLKMPRRQLVALRHLAQACVVSDAGCTREPRGEAA